jgi:hypothetical protein
VHVTVKELLITYRTKVGGSRSSAAIAASCLALALCALVARQGTVTFRLLACAGLIALLSVWLVALVRRRKLREEQHVLRLVLGPKGPLVERASRALALSLSAPNQPGVSVELAELHYQRTLASVDPKYVASRAETTKRRSVALALLAALGLGALTLALPNQVFEGGNVLFARDGVAPVPFEWFEAVSLEAKLPAYMGNRTGRLSWDSAAALPEGTTLSVRGRPLHAGRSLVLWDGETQVPFVQEGEEYLVAHWVVTTPAELRVGARFGDTLILEPGSVQIHSEVDRVPHVALLMDSRDIVLEEVQEVEVRFRVTDDYQVSQVDLVLRALGREERRTLDRPAPGNRRVEGGYVLHANDPFISKSFVPVIVKIEARDNKPDRRAADWGKSETIVIRPQQLGAAQAQRLTALQGIADALVDELSAVKTSLVAENADAQEIRRQSLARLQQLAERSSQTLDEMYSGLPIPKGMVSFTRAQFEKVIAEFRISHGAFEPKLRALERIMLALDAASASLARRDAQDVSKALGDVADEMAFAARSVQTGEGTRQDAIERLDLAVSVLQRGARHLRQLGFLGQDLGSVALADLNRVTTSRSAEDFMHAELAALHMAARLHRPKPSFGAKGGSGAAGVESGSGSSPGEGEESQDGPASDADEHFDRLARDLAELAQEHAQAVERSSSVLDAAQTGLQNDDTSQQAKRRAQALREATSLLPQPGEGPSTSRASAALAREHAVAMAHELEDLNFEQAVENGQRARSAAEEALRRGDLDFATEEAARDVLRELTIQLEWATQQRAEWRTRKEQAAREALQEVARQEQELGERARRLATEGDQSQHGLPSEALAKLQQAEELMRHAARQLGTGEGQQGLNLQRHAQRLLEDAQLGETKGPQPQNQPGQRGRSAGFGGEVPRGPEGTGAQDFRKRVLDGLAGSSGGRLAPAVKRYAEGLLR